MLPRRVFGSYSQAYNRAYGESGTLFQGTYAVRRVDLDSYLRHLCRYIHANPVKQGIATSLDAWPHSNYLEWIGQRSGVLVDRQFIRTHFGTPEQYEAFVGEYIGGRSWLASEMRDFEGNLEL
jgi:putative transposase